MTYTSTYNRDEANNIFDFINNAQVGDTITRYDKFTSDNQTTYRVMKVTRKDNIYKNDPDISHIYFDDYEVFCLAQKADGTLGRKVLKVYTKYNHEYDSTHVEVAVYTKGYVVSEMARMNPDHKHTFEKNYKGEVSSFCKGCVRIIK